MLTHLLSSVLARLGAALLLATIGLQAAEPALAVELSHGSAFSASSHEVALVERVEAHPGQLVPAPLPLREAEVPAPAARVAQAPGVAARPDSTGPPALTVLERQPGPRPPPIA